MMKTRKIFSLFLIFLFLISSFSYFFNSNSSATNISNSSLTTDTTTNQTERPILHSIMEKIFNLGSLTFGFPWFHQEFIPPSFYRVTPQVVDLEYLDQTEIEIAEVWSDGTVKKAMFEPEDTRQGKMQRHLFASQYFRFELIQPYNDSTSGMWSAYFQPDIIGIFREPPSDGGEIPLLKTKLKLKLNMPPDEKYPQEDTNLQIKITRLDNSGNLWIPPNFAPYNKLSSKIFWLIGAATTWGKYSGKTEEIVSFVNVTVRVSSFHKAEVIPPKPIKIGPNELISVKIKVKNLGTRIDTFNFRVKTEKGELLLSAPLPITLKPGEEAEVYLGVASPRWIADQGTTHPVTIECYSIHQPEKVFINTVTITTQGVYISEGAFYYSMFFFIIVFLIILFFLFRRKRKIDRLCKKPEKPWTLPKNKNKLDKLKEKDEEKYNKALKKMEKEYEEEMSLYRDMRKAAVKQIRNKNKEKGFLSSISKLFDDFISVFKTKKKTDDKVVIEEKCFCIHCNAKIMDKSFVICPQCGNRLDSKKPIKPVEPKKQVEKPVKQNELKETKVAEIPPVEPVMPEPQPVSVQKEPEGDDWMKQQAIQRVLQGQEKQKRKLRRR